MNKKQFDNLHKTKGGYSQLKRMVARRYTLSDIATHFGVGKNAVRLWCRELFGNNYDPRLERRKLIVEEMIDYAQKHPEEEFKEYYLPKSKYYYYIALSECYVRGIYGKN